MFAGWLGLYNFGYPVTRNLRVSLTFDWVAQLVKAVGPPKSCELLIPPTDVSNAGSVV